jgi:hypothetical protein
MNCLNIIENYYVDDINEVVFLHHNMQKYEEMVKKHNNDISIYSYEFLFDEYKKRSKLLTRISLIFNLIKGKKAIKKVDNRHETYDCLFIPSENIGCNLAYNYFRESNDSLSLYVYDDGVGTYAKDYLNGKKHEIYEKISILLFGSFFWKNIEKVFCYQPELIIDDELNIERIKIFSNAKVEKLFSQNLSDSLIDKYSKSKVIYLDQGQLPLSYENTTSFLEICNRICDENEVLLKNHPRVKPVYKCNSFIIDNSGNTFESVLFNIEIENKVLVSMCSTSCLTPFILKEKHPYVIFLGMLNTDEYNATFSSLYFQNVITNYESNKIFLPRNNRELEEIIKYCLNK